MRFSVVIPCYNEASRGEDIYSLNMRLKELYVTTTNITDIEIIFVDDCSTDDSVKVINDFIKSHNLDNWRCICSTKNEGKGSALLHGFSAAVGTYICFIDADFSVSPDNIWDIYRLTEHYRHGGRQVCFYGSRYKSDSKIVNERSFARNSVSYISRYLLRLLFGLRTSDTQCGFKVFPRKALSKCLPYVYPSRWLLDVQLLYAMKLQGVELHPYAVTWNNMESQSTIRLLSAIRNSLVDLVKIMRVKSNMKRELS